MSAPLRVLVVDDSLTVRGRIVEVLQGAGMEVVAEASDGRAAIELCARLRPDVMTLDIALPLISGLGVTEYVMAHCPTPILIVSSSYRRGDAYHTHDALAAGAIDVLEKPGPGEDPVAWAERLVSAVRVVARIRPISRPRRGRSPAPLPAPQPPPAPPPRGGRQVGLRAVGIGASTGGTRAVLEVLQTLPARFPLPVLLVLHTSPTFAETLADWLDAQVALPARLATPGPLPAAGCVLVAPPERHLVVQDGRLALSGEPERNFCRPSVDVLFESLAASLGPAAVGCLLTGMGRDGAAGLAALRARGAPTIAQDEATSVVYGMPREAARLGAAQRVLPLGEIGPELVRLSGRADPRLVSGPAGSGEGGAPPAGGEA